MINERFPWAVNLIDIKPDSDILEIGCGAGLLAGEISEKLKSGCITAIDRSEAMIAKAAKRNVAFVEDKRARFQAVSFMDFSADTSFDTIIAFNVNFFLKDSPAEYQKISRLLKPGGKLYVFYQMPHDATKEAVLPVVAALESNGFTVRETILGDVKPVAFCVMARLKI